MPRAREVRIARLGVRVNAAATAQFHERGRRQAIAIIAASVRAGLAREGIDPACAARLREAESAAAAGAELSDIAQPPEADGDGDAAGAQDDPDALIWFLAETRRRARYYEADRAIDFTAAPLADLLAWCVARGAIELHLSPDGDLLLICCKPPDRPREAAPIAGNLSCGTTGLEMHDPD